MEIVDYSDRYGMFFFCLKGPKFYSVLVSFKDGQGYLLGFDDFLTECFNSRFSFSEVDHITIFDERDRIRWIFDAALPF